MAGELNTTIPWFHYGPHAIELRTDHLAAHLPKDLLRLTYGYHLPVDIMRDIRPTRTLNLGDYTSFANVWLASLTEEFHSIDYVLDMLLNHGVPTREAFRIQNEYLYAMDIRNLGFPKDSFDMAVLLEVAGTSKSTGIEFIEKALPEIHRVMKPGAHLVMNHMSATGQHVLHTHPQYAQLGTEFNNGFPNFRGIPIASPFLNEIIAGKFAIVERYGQIHINHATDLPLMRTVEGDKVQYRPETLELKPSSCLNISDTERPLYWYLDMVKL